MFGASQTCTALNFCQQDHAHSACAKRNHFILNQLLIPVVFPTLSLTLLALHLA